MHNPWGLLPYADLFVLADDLPIVDAFNARAKPLYKIRTEAMPEPFFGPFDARVIVLLQNPGFSNDEQHIDETPEFKTALRDYFATGKGPHLHLAASARGPGHNWWMRKTKEFRATAGREAIANNLLAIEYFPYHSIKFAHARLRLPSQDFSFELLKSAIERGCEIIVARGFKLWVEAVPELALYSKVSRLNSAQNIALSSGNMGPDTFARIAATLIST